MRKLLFTTCLLPLSFSSVNADGLDIGDTLNSVADAIQQGVDYIWPDRLSVKGLNVKAGFGFGFIPDYVGSNNYHAKIIPVLSLQYKDKWRLTGSTFTYTAYKKNNWDVGPLMNLRFGRSQDSNRALLGLGDLGTTLELGVYTKYKHKAGYFSAEYRHGISQNIGGSIKLAAGHGLYKSEKFTAFVDARVRWLSQTNMQTNFGIPNTQASNSIRRLDTFRADAGLSEITTNLIGAYALSEKTRLLGLISYGKLLGGAANSPLVAAEGSSNQFIVGTGLVFSF